MKRHIIIYMLLGLAASANAQSDRYGTIYRGPVRFAPGSTILQTDPTTGMSYQTIGSPFISTPIEGYQSQAKQDSEDKREEANNETYRPNSNGKEKNKNKGEFHASMDLSIMAGFGKGAPHGAGFSQNLNAWYTTPIGKKGWLTTGGYLNHINWDGINATGGGLYAELGYQFDEHWAAYVYGQKSLVNSGTRGYGYPFYNGYYGLWGYNNYPGYNPFSDKLGAAVRWTPNHNFSLEISVEKNWYHNNSFANPYYPTSYPYFPSTSPNWR